VMPTDTAPGGVRPHQIGLVLILPRRLPSSVRARRRLTLPRIPAMAVPPTDTVRCRRRLALGKHAMGDEDPPQSASGIGIHSYLSGHTNDHIAREEVGEAPRWIGGPWVQDGSSPGQRVSQAGATQESSVPLFPRVLGPGCANMAFCRCLATTRRCRLANGSDPKASEGLADKWGAAPEPK
jgi:hypothetical protein